MGSALRIRSSVKAGEGEQGPALRTEWGCTSGEWHWVFLALLGRFSEASQAPRPQREPALLPIPGLLIDPYWIMV